MTLRVRVQPRAARAQIAGERGGALLVRLNAPPVEGAANAALTRLIAGALGLPSSAVSILRGASGRDKLLRIEGARAEDVARLATAARKR